MLFGLVVLAAMPDLTAAPGDTTIARWQTNAAGAFTMSFDDSMETHSAIAVPEVIKRGLVGTWFVNPAQPRYINHREVWENLAPDNNQELANHTMTHEGALSYGQAEYEIGECAKIVWATRGPDESRLLAFARGGATNWTISKAEMEELKDRYHSISRSSELSCKTSDGIHAPEMMAKVDQAIDEQRWVAVHFHGIGGEWLPIETDDFLQFLDYLALRRNEVWSAGWSEAHQYQTERDRAHVTVLASEPDNIRLSLVTGLDPSLYAEDLTLLTEVPADWKTVTVVQGDRATVQTVRDGIVQYEARPDREEIVLNPL
jgi:hypothetical protein